MSDQERSPGAADTARNVGTAPALSWDGVWIAIPAYNEARTIRALALAALRLCPRVMVIDDGSTDDTVAQVRDLPLTLLQHAFNQGKAASLRAAFGHALTLEAKCVVTLDGDGQHDPRDAPSLLAVWQAHPDRLVIGARLHDRARIPPARYAANRFACFWISWASGHPIADSQTGFRVYSGAVMRIASSGRMRSSGFTLESEILIEAAQQGHSTLAVKIPARYHDDARPSHYRSVVDTVKIVEMVGARLLKKGMYLHGLWLGTRRAPVLILPAEAVPDGGQWRP
ncbi:MAG: glycosyltransferase family 2 protein [Pseudomonadota bacterium]|nr:glycosyltransferase family 2 protein [Pseudomonadota bacterium]